MKADAATLSKPSLHYYRAPKSVMRRFIAKRVAKTSAILGFIIGAYMYSKAVGFIKAYPTTAARQKIAETLGNNVSIQALLGVAKNVDKVSGYITWNFLCLVAAAGGIWALLLATKTLRGEEDNGRWEQMLSGQTTARRATTNALVALYSGLIIFYVLLVLFLFIIGRLNGADLSHSAIYFFALALICGAAEFLAIGALTSQLMPVRSRATTAAVGVFGLFYAIRVVADTTTAHWLLDISPLGWIERLQPMTGSRPIWLVPIALFVIILCGLTIYLSGKRDLGEGLIKDDEYVKPKYSLLKGPLSASLRLNRGNTIGWLASISLLTLVYGQLAKSSIINTLAQSKKATHALAQVIHADFTKSMYVVDFLAVAYFLLILVMMFYAANIMAQVRSDEAKGYLDNYVVRPISRARWLFSRVILAVGVIATATVISSLLFFICQLGQNNGITYLELLKASLNAAVPSLMILGVGVFIYGILPRLTIIFAYGAVAWAFLIYTLGTGLNLNHWLVDTSILHHISFAPAVSPAWKTNGIILIISLILMGLGFILFNRRDLTGD